MRNSIGIYFVLDCCLFGVGVSLADSSAINPNADVIGSAKSDNDLPPSPPLLLRLVAHRHPLIEPSAFYRTRGTTHSPNSRTFVQVRIPSPTTTGVFLRVIWGPQKWYQQTCTARDTLAFHQSTQLRKRRITSCPVRLRTAIESAARPPSLRNSWNLECPV